MECNFALSIWSNKKTPILYFNNQAVKMEEYLTAAQQSTCMTITHSDTLSEVISGVVPYIRVRADEWQRSVRGSAPH